jgi:hypothetical protein
MNNDDVLSNGKNESELIDAEIVFSWGISRATQVERETSAL